MSRKIRIYPYHYEDVNCWEVIEDHRHNPEVDQLVKDKEKLEWELKGLCQPHRDRIARLEAQFNQQLSRLEDQAKELLPDAEWIE